MEMMKQGHRQGLHTALQSVFKAAGHHPVCSELPVVLKWGSSNQMEGLNGYHRQLCHISFQLETLGELDEHLEALLSEADSTLVYFV